MKKGDRGKLKKMTLTEFKHDHPELVENIRRQAREEIHTEMDEMKQEIKENNEKIKAKKEEKERLTAAEEKEIKELNETYNNLLARKAELILNEQKWEQSELIKKKLKNMPNFLVAILEPALSLCSSQEAMDSIIEEALSIYQATHPGGKIGIVEKKNDWPERMTEEMKQGILDKEFKEAFE